MMMRNALTLALLAAGALFGQYKMETAAAPPADLAAPLASLLSKEGVKITSNGQVYCELWLRSGDPAAGKITEEGATVTTAAHGALFGVIKFPANVQDRRGQAVKAGVYTLRLSFHPVNGDHQGVAPQRDFLLLTPIAADADPAATPDFETLMGWSRKASGTPHPAVLSLWKVDNDFRPGFAKMGENDWVLQTKIGGLQVAIILVGKAEG